MRSVQSVAVTENPPCLTDAGNGKTDLVCSPTGKDVTVFSTRTRTKVGLLAGHTDTVTCVVPDYKAGHVLTGSRDGTVRRWELAQRSCVETFKTPAPVVAMELAPAQLVVVLDLVDSHTVVLLPIAGDGTRDAEFLECSPPNTRINHMSVSPMTGRFICCSVGNMLYVYCTEVKRIIRSIANDSRISAVKVDYQDRFVATGDYDGVVNSWDLGFQGTGVGNQQQAEVFQAAQRRHWHAREVACLGLTSDGTLMLSGGVEGVLCVWHLDSDHVRYIPRVGAPISQMATRQARGATVVILALSDNSLRVVDLAEGRPGSHIQALDLHIYPMDLDRTAPKLVPTMNSSGEDVLAYNGTGVRVQLWDTLRGAHKSFVTVQQRNMVATTKGGDGRAEAVWTLDALAFSGSGELMVTTEYRRESKISEIQEYKMSCVLKFWSRNDNDSGYRLDTIVYDAHSTRISAVMVPKAQAGVVITADEKGEFRTWGRRADNPGNPVPWASTGSGTWKGIGVASGDVSPDGTFFALGHNGGWVSLWSCPDLVEKSSIRCSSLRPINQLKITVGMGRLLLVAMAQRRLMVYDLATLEFAFALVSVDQTFRRFDVGHGGFLATLSDTKLSIYAWREGVENIALRRVRDTVIEGGLEMSFTTSGDALMLVHRGGKQLDMVGLEQAQVQVAPAVEDNEMEGLTDAFERLFGVGGTKQGREILQKKRKKQGFEAVPPPRELNIRDGSRFRSAELSRYLDPMAPSHLCPAPRELVHVYVRAFAVPAIGVAPEDAGAARGAGGPQAYAGPQLAAGVALLEDDLVGEQFAAGLFEAKARKNGEPRRKSGGGRKSQGGKAEEAEGPPPSPRRRVSSAGPAGDAPGGADADGKSARKSKRGSKVAAPT